ncbi:cytochrome c oxidase accessory protein FixG [Breoghania corrubedonensis]|uniref:Cytochrome c oxidase accessory protein FixG n=1 Tax=Breoghania corrubedonensis TaxID=665038 RepID=A0A2T5VEB1_9HYPH|nr:cytochrome c oxidase accessory protein FixG [Breoghania corrubedonensis]
MRIDRDANPAHGEPGDEWFAASKKIYPMAVHGRFRKIKWTILILTLGLYYFLPFVRWDRGPDAPGQAVMVDLAGRRAYLFFIEIWPQEVYYLTGLLILAAMALFLMNAVAGRLWCGYLCPQTVWTDLFMAVERWTEGDRRERMNLDKASWSAGKLGRKASKHFLWLMIAWWTGGAWVLYFADAPTLVKDLATGQAPMAAYAWIGILTFTTYALAGHMREQVCVFMCPWPRIQAALTDEYALNVTYRWDRGEPRGSLKQGLKRQAEGLKAGDCVDCYQCLHSCPTGVDIRKGTQLDCIQCGLCIDACDAVMEKIGKPKGLIGYDNDQNVQERSEGRPAHYQLLRPRTIVYAALIAIIGAVMLYALVTRSFEGINVLHDRNPIYVKQSDGTTRNGYTIRILNKRPLARDFVFGLEHMPFGTRIEVVGAEGEVGGYPIVSVGPDRTREFRVLLFSPLGADMPKSTPITFRIVDTRTGDTARADDYFKAE